MPIDEFKCFVFKRADRNKYTVQWTDPVTGRTRQKSTGKTNRRAAERWAADFERELLAGSTVTGHTPWAEFKERYIDEGLVGLADGTIAQASATLNRIESLIGPKSVQVLAQETTVAKFRRELLKVKVKRTGRGADVGQTIEVPISPATVNKHLRVLKAMLRWAQSIGLICRVPVIKMIPRASQRAKARAVTGEEFDRMLAAVHKVVEGEIDQANWTFFLKGLWWSGLRLSEALKLRWHEGPIHLDTGGKHPLMHFESGSQKNRKDQTSLVVPEFWQLLALVPEAMRTGRVFCVGASRTKVGKTVTEIGEKARVMTSIEKGKWASAHDLRRAFCVRWATRVPPTTLMRLTRHSSTQTTMSFYVGQEVESVAEAVWGARTPSDNAGSSDISSDNWSESGHGNSDESP